MMKLTCSLLPSILLQFAKFPRTIRAAIIITRHLTAVQTARPHAPEFRGFAVELDGGDLACRSSVLSDALQVFDEMPHCDVVSATSLIGQLAKQNYHKEAALLFSRMVERNIRPNDFTFGTVIHSSVVLKDLALGKQFHASAVKMGLYSNVFVGGALVDLYVKLRNIEEAQKMIGIHDMELIT
ncbi:OLC1v1034757C1 [Oldenlandia corymbosa var. corymbosa]|uniref:OLC1v1034757C1 n=1 Tax=Oldenlandia corymbosa var. corymbosa TaxID=529605 RepID=A0AAV1CT37_OLDCO|nr:OLC1v1034757C1 [Oldenlandia corymbosa var. corymbosa]